MIIYKKKSVMFFFRNFVMSWQGVDDITGEALVRREDDSVEAVTRRYAIFEESVSSLHRFYEDLGLLRTFRGTETNAIWPEVRQELLAHLGEFPSFENQS